MPVDYKKLSEHSDWWPDTIKNQQKVPNYLAAWLLDKGSLTAALTQLSGGNFCVELKRQVIGKVYLHEEQKLSLQKNQQGLIREVELHIHNQAVVFARSIIPIELTGDRLGSLENLGNKPLGHLLFKDGNIRVSKREFAEIKTDEKIIFARRTPYDYEDQQILVSEFFLPEFEQHIKKG